MATSPAYLEVIEKALKNPAYLDDLIRDLKKGKKKRFYWLVKISRSPFN